jgi:methylated-DNA-[protein]-cysteine S-methyltransferase
MKKTYVNLLSCIIDHSLTDVTVFGIENSDGIIITGLLFDRHRLFENIRSEPSSHPVLLSYAESIKKFLDGTMRDLSRIPIDLSWCTPFTRKVLLAARNIAWGQTVSYAKLALMAGNPGAIRAAASVMRNNRFPLIVPCHRVIKSDGSIGGFMGKQAGMAVALKKKLLEKERSYY